LDWAPKFKDTLKPIIEECYQNVLSGEEARISIKTNSKADYREQLEKELREINDQEMWQAGKQLRPLRPENI
jgi:ketol-acid reductoisomerase